MPVSQGSGGYMPGMTLRAWAVVSAAGVLIKGSPNVASAANLSAGKYTITLSDGNVSANAVLKGVGTNFSISAPAVGLFSAPAANVVTFAAIFVGSNTLFNMLCHVELWE